MHSFCMQRVSLLVAAVAFAAGTANAQAVHSDESASEVTPSTSESTSTAGPLFAVDGADGAAALPAAPSPNGNGKGNGQGSYDSHNGGFFSRMAWEAGGGFNAPAGDDITWGWNINLGGGMQFNQRLSALIEYQFIHDKLPGQLINEVGATGGYAHIWSFTVAPVVDLFPKATNDVYITGGGGFYRKVTSFTDPELSQFCYYYYCGVGVVNVVVGHFSSNQGGWNVGAGYQHRMGGIYGDSRMKLFAEARYLDVLTPATSIAPNGLGVAAVSEGTKLIPVTLGVRW